MYTNENHHNLIPVNYNRKSTEAEDRQVLSLDSQIEAARKIGQDCGLREFLEDIRESRSAKTEFKRPEFSRMVTILKSGKANSIVCWKLDRLARNMTEGGMLIDMLSSGIIKAIFTHEKVYYPSDNMLILSLEFGQGKQYIKDLSLNVKRGHLAKAKEGYPPGIAPIGYRNNINKEKGRSGWIVDENRFPLVKNAFESFLTGKYSVAELYRATQEFNPLTTILRRKIGGRPLAISKFYTLLANPIYAGHFYYAGERYELNKEVPRIITEQQHYQILKMMRKPDSSRNQHEKLTYTGIIKSENGNPLAQDIKKQVVCDCKYKFSACQQDWCPNCGLEIKEMKTPTHRQYQYYFDNLKKKKRLMYKCISESQIDAELTYYIKSNLSFTNELINWTRKHIELLKVKEIQDAITEKKRQEKRKQDFERTRTSHRHYLIEGFITPEEYEQDLRELYRMNAAAKDIETNILWFDRINDILDQTKIACKIIESGKKEDKRSLLSILGKNLTWDGNKLCISSFDEVNVLIKHIQSLKSEIDGFEPKKSQNNHNEQGNFQNDTLLEPQVPYGRGMWDEVRTAYINRIKREAEEDG